MLKSLERLVPFIVVSIAVFVATGTAAVAADLINRNVLEVAGLASLLLAGLLATSQV